MTSRSDEPRPFDVRASRCDAEQRLVDGVAGERADEAAGNGADRPEHGAAGRRAGDGKNECCHESLRYVSAGRDAGN